MNNASSPPYDRRGWSLSLAMIEFRAAVQRAGGAEAFAAGHPDLTTQRVLDWMTNRGVPSHAAFRLAGIKVVTVYQRGSIPP